MTAGGEEHDLRRAYAVLFVVGMGSFQTAMALSIIFVIFPDVEQSFPDTSAAELSWVINAFTIVGAATLVLGSAVSERYGRKRVFLAGSAAFSLASLLAALAPSVEVIIAARVLQALAASLTLPTGATLVLHEFPIERRATAIGVWSAVGAVAAALGPSLGGVIIDAGSWRWAFGMNLPIGMAAVTVGWIVLAESYGERDARLPDRLGALMLLGGVGLLVYGLVQTEEWGWGDGRTIGCVVVGSVLVALLVWRSAVHPRPVLQVDLFRIGSYGLGNLAMVLYALSFFGFQLVSVQFLTKVWDYSIRDAGLLSTPNFVATGIMSALAGRVADRVGHRWAVIPGGLLWSAGMTWMWLGLEGERDLFLWLAAVSVAGVGSGLMWGGLFGVIMRDLPAERLSIGASVNQTMQRIGNAVGVALAVTVIGATVVEGRIGDFPSAFAIIVVTGLVATAAVGLVGPRPHPPPGHDLAPPGHDLAPPGHDLGRGSLDGQREAGHA